MSNYSPLEAAQARIAKLEIEDRELEDKITQLREEARDATVNGTTTARTTENVLALNMRREAIVDALEVLRAKIGELEAAERKKGCDAALETAQRHRENTLRYAILFDTAMREAGDAFAYILDSLAREEAAMGTAGKPRTNALRHRLNTRLIGTVRATAPDLSRALDLPGVNRDLEQTFEILVRKYFQLDAEEVAA